MELKLPSVIGGKRELIQLQREVEKLAEERLQARVAKREAREARTVSSPSTQLQQLLDTNKIELTDKSLVEVARALSTMRDKAPKIQISFAAEPTDEVLQKFVRWFRDEVDPHALVQVGVQPSIAGGVVVQTEKKRYDYSLRSKVVESVDIFRGVLNRGK